MIPPQDEFDSTINRILDHKEYSHLHNFFRNFIDNLTMRDWIVERLTNLNWDISPSVPENLSTILIIIASLVLIAIIALVVVTILRGFDKQSRLKEILGEKIDETTTPGSLRSKADQLKKQGDYRQAIRYDFIALLFLMHEQTILYLDKAKTNLELSLQLKEANFPGQKDFSELIAIYNSIWYGHKQCQREIYEKWNSRNNQLWNEVKDYEKQK